MTQKKLKKVTQVPVVIAAIAGIVILECMAMYQGMNGTMLKVVIALVAGLGGYLMPSPIKQ